MGHLLQLLEEHHFDGSADLSQKKEDRQPSRRTTSSDNQIQSLLATQLANATGEPVMRQLAQLYTDSPQLYEQAMAGLQQTSNNADISQLHADVVALRTEMDTAVQRQEGSLGGSGTDSDRALPDAVQDKMETAFAADFSDVSIQEGPQAPEIGALAYAQGEEVHFAPGEFSPETTSGQELLGHELAHVVQQREGRVGGPTTTAKGVPINADPALEKEADDLGSKAARGESARVSGASTGGSQRKTAQAKAPPQRAAGDKIVLYLASKTLEVDKDGSDPNLIQKGISWSPVPGLDLNYVTIELDEAGDIQTGSITGTFSAGDYVSSQNVRLSVDRTGNVSASIQGAQLKIGELVLGTIDCTVSAEGITGRATVIHQQINVGQGLTVKQGTLTASLDTDGNISANGTLQLGIAGIGTLTLTANLQNTVLTGRAILALDQPVDVVSGVKLEALNLSGEYTQQGFTLNGSLTVNVKNWARAEITGSFKYSEKLWSCTGKVTQISPITVGDLQIDNGELTVTVDKNVLKEVSAKADWQYKAFKGDIKGTYDVPGHRFTGGGRGQLTRPIALGNSGAMLNSASGSIKIENNVLKEIKGNGVAEIPYKGNPAFRVTVEEATLDVPNSQFTGNGSAEIIAPVTIGSGSTTATFNSGKATASVDKNNFKEATLDDVQFQVSTTVAEQTVQLSGNVQGGSIRDGKFSVKADATLDNAVTFTQGNTTVTLESGKLNVDVKNNTLESLTFRDINIAASTVVDGQPLRLKGQLSEGGISGGKVTFKGEIGLDGVFQIQRGTTTVKLNEGKVVADVQESALVEAGIKGLKFEVSAMVANSPMNLNGEVTEGLLKPDGFTLKATAKLSEKYVLNRDPHILSLYENGEVVINLQNSALEEISVNNLRFDAQTQVADSPLKIKGELKTARVTSDGFDLDAKAELDGTYTYNKAPVVLTVDSGTVGLKVKMTSLEEATFDVHASANVTVEGAASPLSVSGGITGGKYTPASGLEFNAGMQLDQPFTYVKDKVKLTVESGQIGVEVKQSALKVVRFDAAATAEITVENATNPLKLSGNITGGTYKPEEGLTLNGGLALVPPFVYQKDKVKLTFKSGNIGLEVKNNILKKVDFNIDVDAEVTVENAAAPLKLNGNITDGKYRPGEGISFNTKLSLTPPFVYQKDKVKLTFKSGEIGVNVKSSTIEQVTFNIDVDADVTVENAAAPLKLNGNITDGKYKPGEGVSFNTKLSLIPTFIYQTDKVKLTFKSGEIGVNVKSSTIEQVTFNIDVDADVTIENAAAPLKLNGNITDGKYKPGEGVSFNTKLSLIPTFIYQTDKVKLTFKSGEIGVNVKSSAIEEVTFNIDVDADITVENAAAPLKLNGNITDGKYKPGEGVSFNTKLSLIPTFIYQTDKVKLTFKSGEIGVNVKSNAIEEVTFNIDVDADITVENAAAPLKLNGNITDGKYKPGEGVSFNTRLSLIPTFIYQTDKVKLTFKSGEIGVNVKSNAIEQVTFNIDVDAEVTVENASGPLKLNGNITDGKYKPGEGVSFNSKLTLIPPFIFEKDKVKLTFNSGEIGVNVKSSAIEEVSFNIDVDAEITVENATDKLKLHGDITGGTYKPGQGITFDSSLTLTPTFVYEKDKVKLTFKSGQIKVDVDNSSLTQVTFNINVDAEVKIDNAPNPLKLNGDISNGTYKPGEGVGFKATLKLIPPFIFEKDKVKLTFKSGQIGVDVKSSALTLATFNIDVDAEVKIDNAPQPLKLNGNIPNGTYKPGVGVSFDATLKLIPPFVFEKGKVKLTFKSGQIGVNVKNNSLTQATFNIDVDAEVKIDDAPQPLKLNGNIPNGTYKPGEGVGFKATLKLVPPFVFEKDKVKLTFKSGQIGVDVKANALIQATFNIDVDAEVKIDDAPQPLKLNGNIPNGTYKPGEGVAFDATLKLIPPFVYEKGKVKLTFKSGQIGVNVKNNSLTQATFNINVDAEVKIDDAPNPLKLNGDISNGTYKPGEGVGFNATLKLIPTFVYEKDKVKLTFKSGEIGVDVKANALIQATFNINVDAEVKIDDAPNPLKLNGDISNGTYKPGEGVGFKATLSLIPTFIYQKDKVKLTFKSGEIGVDVKANALIQATFNVDVDAEVTIENASTPLKVNGQITNGIYKPGEGVGFNATLTLVPPFVYEKDKVKFTLNSGSLGVKVKSSALEEVSFNVNASVEVNVENADGPLKISGQITKGKYTPSGGLEFNAKLTLDSVFIYRKEPVVVKLNSGEIGVDVKATALKEATFAVEAEVETTIQNADGPLKLKGSITKGKYTPTGGVDFDASLELAATFTYNKSPVTIRFLSGKLGVKVEGSAFKEATFDNIKVDLDVDIKGQTLALEGSLTNGKYKDGKVEFKTGLKLREQFNYQKDKVTVRFLSGELGADVKDSKLKEATFNNIKAEVDVDIKGQILALEGQITNGSYKDDKVGFDATLKLRSEFIYEKDKVKATFKSGKLGIKVKNSAFEEATFANIVVLVEVKVEAQTLQVEGSITDGSYKDEKITFNASLKLVEAFVYEKGKVKATLQSGKVGVKIKNSKLDEFTFDNVKVLVEVKVEAQTLQVEGSITDGKYKDGKITFNASLKLVAAFVYEKGKVKATFQSGKVGVKIKNSKLDEFTFDNVKVLVEVKVEAQTLQVEGSITDGKYKDGKISFNASLKLVTAFVYEKGKVKATLQSGKVGVKIKNSKLDEFTFDNVKVLVEVKVEAQTLQVEGSITDGKYKDGKISFNASLKLVTAFVYEKGKVKATLQSGKVGVKIKNSKLDEFTFDDVKVLVEVKVEAQTLQVEGSITDGKYKDGKISFKASLKLLTAFVYEKGKIKATLVSGEVGVKVTNSTLDEFTFDNIVVNVEVKIGEKKLKVKGTVNKGKYKDGKIEFEATLKVAEDFIHTTDTILATLKSGGEVGVKVKNSALEEFTFKSIVVLIEAKVGEKKLYVKGTLDNGKYKDGLVEFDATLSLEREFSYTKGDVTARLKSGTVGVKVEANKVKHFTFTNVVVTVEVINIGPQNQTIKVKGTITDGKYENGMVRFNATLSLENDFIYEQGNFKFTLKKGGSAGVIVEDNKVKEVNVAGLSVTAEAKLMDKTLKISGSINSGKYSDGNFDVNATLSLDSPFVLFDRNKFKATLTSASVTVDVKRGELETIDAEGRADIAVAVSNADISGYLQVKYKYRKASNENLFSGKGKLSVKMLEGKLSGEVDAELFEDGKWKIKGSVTYQMNKFIKGTIGIEMDQELDPIMSGTLTVTNKQLLAGRDLFSIKSPIIPWVETTVVVVVVPVVLGFGVDFAFKVYLQPVTFSASIKIENFRPLNAKVPDFTAKAEINAGLEVKLGLIPYATLGIGVNKFSAGFKLKGGVEFNAPITASPYLTLRGKDDKFSGEFGINVKVAPSVTLSVEGLLYANALGKSVSWGPDFLKYSKTLADLFNWEWNGAYKFGDDGPQPATASAAPQAEPAGAPTHKEQMVEGADSGLEGFDSEKKATNDSEGPQLGEETKAKEPGSGPMAEFKQKMDKAKEWATHIAKVAKLVGFVAEVIGLAVALSWLAPPFGPILGAVIAIIKNGDIVATVSEGLSSLMWLVAEGAEILWELMPDWVKDIKEVLDGGAVYAADKLYEWGEGNISGTWWPVFRPIFDWCKGVAQSFVEAVGKMDGSMGGFIEGLVDLVVAGISSLKALYDKIKEMISELVKLIQKLVYDGDIIATNMNPDDWGKDPWYWKLNIPGIVNDSGEGDGLWNWGVGNLVSAGLKNVFGCKPNTHVNVDYGFWY
jgi:hypothetical protein